MKTPRPPLRVALLTSRRAPGLRQLLEDPARGELFELVVGVVTVAASSECVDPEDGRTIRHTRLASLSLGITNTLLRIVRSL